jgi:anti-anti-sigma factor
MSDRDTITLSGPLTVREVPDVAARHAAAFEGASVPAIVRLDQLDGVDSSALALLLEWQSRAHEAGRRIRFEQPPQSLRVIARLTGVAPLLDWDENLEHANEDAS